MPLLEIAKKLAELGDALKDPRTVAVLNLPAANRCEKRAELVTEAGALRQACEGCVTQRIPGKQPLGWKQIQDIIDHFGGAYSTRWLTVNGRGDPFYPTLAAETLRKLVYGKERWSLQGYVFTAGQNLDERTCATLAALETNVMMSLYGNRFLGPEFFDGAAYPTASGRLQDQAAIAAGFRRLIAAYRAGPQPDPGTSRLGMNYVVRETDLCNPERARELKAAVEAAGIAFISNVPFQPHPDPGVQQALRAFALELSNGIPHSTAVNGVCQMGAGSSATIDYDGTLFRCPYMSGAGNGNFFALRAAGELDAVLRGYRSGPAVTCVMRDRLVSS